MSKAKAYAGGPVARYTLMGAALFLTLFGLVMIYSASSITAAQREGSSTHFFLRQIFFAVVSVGMAWLLSRWDYRRFKNSAQKVWYGAIVLLVAVLALGVVRGGARRWIPLGFMNLQPSELAKIACVLLVAAVAVEWQRGRTDDKQFLSKVAVATGLPAVLIIMQPDLGTTMTLIAAVAFVLLLAGIDWKWVMASGGLMVGLGVLMIVVAPYRMKRFTAFLDPWADPQGKGYQTVQALLAFGTGGVDGVGLGLSRQKFFYLPEAHTDFILAIIGEEAGLIGTLAVLAGFALFVWAGFKIATGARDPYGRLVAGGITGMLGFQAVLNMAAVTSLMPVTGKPLPFVSYGGSSMLVTMIAVGLLLSVSEYGMLAPRAVKPKRRAEEPRRESGHERRRDGGPRVSSAGSSRPLRRRA